MEKDLVVKRAKILEIKKEIAWIGSEFSSMKSQWDVQVGLKKVVDWCGTNYGKLDIHFDTHPSIDEKVQIAIWYDYLLQLVEELKEMKADISKEYKSLINSLQMELKRHSYKEYADNNPVNYL